MFYCVGDASDVKETKLMYLGGTYVYIDIYIYQSVCIFMYVSIHMYVYIYVYRYVFVCINMFTYIYAYTYVHIGETNDVKETKRMYLGGIYV
jgi:hypothetical protein